MKKEHVVFASLSGAPPVTMGIAEAVALDEPEGTVTITLSATLYLALYKLQLPCPPEPV